jgi:transposase
MFSRSEGLSLNKKGKQTPMKTAKTILYVGLDVHKESIAVALADSDGSLRRYGEIPGHIQGVDKLIQKLQKPGQELRLCYEAGPFGFVLCRHLRQRGFVCEVVAPSLIPKRAGDRVKTDARDAEQLARLFRAGELTAVRVPDEADEAVRDLMRGRLSAVFDQRRARQRLKGFLLRLGFRYPGKTSWTPAHMNYLSKLKMPHAAQQIVLEEYVQAIQSATERVERLTTQVQAQLAGWKWEPVVRALMCLRGISVINGMTLVAEIGDIDRFDNPRQLMSFLGLVPSEHSSGGKRHQGAITKAGNGSCRRALVEAAHHYWIAPRISPTLRQRQHGQPEQVRQIAWKAQQRLYARQRALSARKKKAVVVVAAVARELCGFVWAICRALKAPTANAPVLPSTGKARVYVLKRHLKFQSGVGRKPAPQTPPACPTGPRKERTHLLGVLR